MDGHRMQKSPSEIVNLSSESATDRTYYNHPVANVNDHVVRISVMTEAYYWHCHPDSDETFLALEGGLMIDLDDETLELKPGSIFTVKRGVRHRTRPLGTRSVNLTFERADATTERLPPPGGCL
jgi:mannose-6-phosphate isomerase-like protein (cupin superfamily)